MKSHVKLFTTVLAEAGRYCGVNTSADWKYISRRLSSEGESFLTIVLPAYDKDLLRALDQGQISSDLFTGFRHSRGFPLLFSGFLRMIFDKEGVVRETSLSMINAIRMLRQVLLLLSKIELESSEERENHAILAYRITDAELPSTRDDLSDHSKAAYSFVRDAFRATFGEFCNELEKILIEDPFFRGNHGPGAVADHTGNNARWSKTTWTTRLESILPAESTLACNVHDYLDQQFEWLDEDDEPPVRVVTVPKTMKGPRVIAIEPVHMQYVQQGLFKMMTRLLSTAQFSRLNAMMGWMDQQPNRELAKNWERYATLDLSEASDRVSFALVEQLFESWPNLWNAISASRSLRAQLPDGEVISLKKFASMGSALCFPIESMVFAAIAVAAKCIHESNTGQPYLLHPDKKRALSARFRIFGDDIIVPKDWTPYLLDLLGLCGLKVNTRKSFWTGKFRESCGADWYDGYDVSVVRVRRTISPNRQDVNSIVRGISLHNRLFERGMYESAALVETALQAVTPLPYAALGVDVLALWTHDSTKPLYKMDRHLQKPTVKAVSLKYKYKEDVLDGYGALRKYFIGSDEPIVTPWDYDVLRVMVDPKDPEHLLRSGRPVHVAMNVRYVALN